MFVGCYKDNALQAKRTTDRFDLQIFLNYFVDFIFE